jgi:hypothetical protein
MFSVLMALAFAASGAAKVAHAQAKAPPAPATDAELSTIRSTLDNELYDAESARLKGFQIRHYQPWEPDHAADACGMVNAKNRFGAYTGFQPYYLVLYRKDGRDQGIILGKPDSLAKKFCDDLGM